MKPDLSFLARIRSQLENLWGGGGQENASPLKVKTPTPTPTRTPEETRKKFIGEGWNATEMTPQEVDMANRARYQKKIPGENYLNSSGIPDPQVTPSFLQNQQMGEVMGVSAPRGPEPTAAPGIDNALEYFRSMMPASGSQTMEQYYPALGDQEFMNGVQEADKKRQGLAALLLLQAFFESTLGRATNGGNLYGVLPGGEGSGVQGSFASPSESLNYQLGPNVLGGGANSNMNILNEGDTSPLTPSRVSRLYESYNPNSPYASKLIDVLFGNK